MGMVEPLQQPKWCHSKHALAGVCPCLWVTSKIHATSCPIHVVTDTTATLNSPLKYMTVASGHCQRSVTSLSIHLATTTVATTMPPKACPCLWVMAGMDATACLVYTVMDAAISSEMMQLLALDVARNMLYHCSCALLPWQQPQKCGSVPHAIGWHLRQMVWHVPVTVPETHCVVVHTSCHHHCSHNNAIQGMHLWKCAPCLWVMPKADATVCPIHMMMDYAQQSPKQLALDVARDMLCHCPCILLPPQL